MALGASHFQWFALMATPHLGVEPSEKDPKRGIPSSVDPQALRLIDVKWEKEALVPRVLRLLLLSC